MDIKKVIKKQGWTLDRLAAEMTNKRGGKRGISQSSLSQLLNGKTPLDRLQEISSIIGIPVSELLREEDEQRSTSITCPHCGQVIKIHVE